MAAEEQLDISCGSVQVPPGVTAMMLEIVRHGGCQMAPPFAARFHSAGRGVGLKLLDDILGERQRCGSGWIGGDQGREQFGPAAEQLPELRRIGWF